jgi:high-affinity Fe2+/Pb2+ permease
MNEKLQALDSVFRTMFSVTALGFMGYVFYSEIFGHGVTYIEPNLLIAKIELSLIVLAVVAVLAHFVRENPKR